MINASLKDILLLVLRENMIFIATFCIFTLIFGFIYAIFGKRWKSNGGYVTATATLIIIESSLAVIIDVLYRFFG